MGFRISWDTVALISANNFFSPLTISYNISDEMSIIYKSSSLFMFDL